MAKQQIYPTLFFDENTRENCFDENAFDVCFDEFHINNDLPR